MRKLETSIYTLFLLTFLLLGSASTLSARHIVGGDVSYEFVSFSQNNTKVTFRVVFNIYRDRITNTPYDPDAVFGIYQKQSNGDWAFYDTAIADPQNIDTISYVDDPCLEERSDVGVESAFYEVFVTLDIIDRDYMIAYQRCCRNTSSNNINNAIVGTVFDVIITPEAQRTGNNSSTFTEYPPIFICVNYPLSVDISAQDTEGDDLSYSFCSPLQAGGATISDPCLAIEPAVSICLPPFDKVDFIAPFSASNPMGGNPAVAIDPQTGILSGIPELVGQYVVGVCVEERRNGILLSKIRRDFQFNVVPCEKAIAATLFTDGSQAGSGGVINVLKSCGDSIVNFESGGIGASVSKFEWKITHPDGSVFYEEEGSQLDNLSLTFNDIGEYNGYLVVNDGSDCQDTAFFSVGRFPGVKSNFEAIIDSCYAAPITFNDLSISEGNQVVSWEWDLNGEFSTTDQNVVFDFPLTGVKNIGLITIDDNDCTDTIVRPINYNPPHPASNAVSLVERLCFGDSIFFDERWIKEAGNYGDVLQYVETGCDSVGRMLSLSYWPTPFESPFDTMICNGEVVEFYGMTYDANGEYRHTIASEISGCDSIVEKLILEVQEPPAISLANNVVVAGNTNYNFPIGVTGDYERVEWFPPIGLSCTDCLNPTLNSNTDTTYTVQLFTEAECLASADVSVNFVVVPESYFFPTLMSKTAPTDEDGVLFLQTLEEALESVTYDLQVMDRWGTLHFDGKELPINNRDLGWSSRTVLPGVYVYRFVIHEYFETRYEVGTVSVIK